MLPVGGTVNSSAASSSSGPKAEPHPAVLQQQECREAPAAPSHTDALPQVSEGNGG